MSEKSDEQETVTYHDHDGFQEREREEPRFVNVHIHLDVILCDVLQGFKITLKLCRPHITNVKYLKKSVSLNSSFV